MKTSELLEAYDNMRNERDVLLAENKRLREALELALKTLQDIQRKYYGDPIPDSVFEVVTSALK